MSKSYQNENNKVIPGLYDLVKTPYVKNCFVRYPKRFDIIIRYPSLLVTGREPFASRAAGIMM